MKNLGRSSQHETMPEVQNDTKSMASSPQQAHLERPWCQLDTHPPSSCPQRVSCCFPTSKYIGRLTTHKLLLSFKTLLRLLSDNKVAQSHTICKPPMFKGKEINGSDHHKSHTTHLINKFSSSVKPCRIHYNNVNFPWSRAQGFVIMLSVSKW